MADLLAQTDHHTQLPTIVDMDGAEDTEGDVYVDLDAASPDAPQQERMSRSRSASSSLPFDQ